MLAPRDALYMIMTGRPINGKQAAEMRLVNSAVPPEKLAEATLDLAEELKKKNPTVLAYCKEVFRVDQNLTLEDAIRKMTSLPAQVLGLRDRGVLREGWWADLVAFDPDTVADTATYDRPQQYPQGIPYVLVNGELVIDRGEHTGRRPGRVVYGPGKAG